MTIEEVLAVEEMQVFDRKSVNIAPKVLAIPIIAFANADGGTVAIGISDKTRRIEGVDYDIQKLNELLRVPFDFCVPTVKVEIEKVQCIDFKGRENHVLLMHIEPSMEVHANQADEVFMRVGDKSKKLAFMINEYAAYMTASGRDPVRAEIREVIGYSHLDFINRFQGYNDKWDGHKIADSFVKIFELFDLMTSGKNQVIFAQGNKYFDEQALFKWIIENNDTEKADNKSGISYSTRIQADAYLGFIIQNNSLISTPDVFKEKLIDWMRVVMTLSRETNYNGGDDYVRAISKGVRKMLPESGDILTYLDKLTDRSGHGFDGDCFDEECLKAKLILRSPEWEKLVIAAEDNKYFNGQIGFLFEISGIDKQFKNACVDKWDAATDQEYRSLFEKYFNIFSSIFGEFTIAGKNDKYVGINRNIANVLRRALLCKGDYTLFHSSNSSFLIDNDRDISWKRLLRIQSNEKNGTYQNRRKMFFSLIKDPLFDQNDIADSLQKICDRDVAGITDWRKYFITVPEIMDSLHKYTDGRASERYVRFEGKYIFLMGSTRLYGWNEEYYSYALYCLLKKLPNASVKYNQAKGWEDVDCHIELTSSTNAGKWKIKYLRAKDKFSVIDASGVQSLYSTVEDAKYALEKLL